jgi:hypothetical protein
MPAQPKVTKSPRPNTRHLDQAPIKNKSAATLEPTSFKGGSWLACDGINPVCLLYRGVSFAGKPAPTEKQIGERSLSQARRP